MKNKNVNMGSSKTDFFKFFSNKMSAFEKSKFILNTEKDEFENEAVNGYRLFPNAVLDINEINNKIQVKSKHFTLNYINIYFYTVFVIVASIIIAYFIFPTNNKIKKNNFSNTNTKKTVTNNNKINALNSEIKNATEIAIDKQISVTQTRSDQVLIRNYEKITLLEKINTQHINVNKSDSLNNENILLFVNVATSYMYDFKIVDYSKIYNNKIKSDIFINNGLSAKFENNQNVNNENVNLNESNYITYSQFLSENMRKVSLNKYKEALQNFVIIIEQFPNDQNAHFYGGLCYYNLGLYQKSIEHFNAIIESKIVVFYQEAEWYKALSLINLNNNIDAKECLNKIILAKGFYAKRANEKLLQIEK